MRMCSMRCWRFIGECLFVYGREGADGQERSGWRNVGGWVSRPKLGGSSHEALLEAPVLISDDEGERIVRGRLRPQEIRGRLRDLSHMLAAYPATNSGNQADRQVHLEANQQSVRRYRPSSAR